MTDEEQEIVEVVARLTGSPLMPEEVFLSLVQARQVGELPYDPAEGCGYRAD